MAKILKVGYMSVPEYNLVCKHCGTLATYAKRELRFWEDMDDDEMVSFTCPHCDKETSFHISRLPKPCNEKEIGEIKANEKKNIIQSLKMLTNWWGG